MLSSRRLPRPASQVKEIRRESQRTLMAAVKSPRPPVSFVEISRTLAGHFVCHFCATLNASVCLNGNDPEDSNSNCHCGLDAD